MSAHRVLAEVIHKEELAPGVFRLKLHSEEISKEAQPGQFVHVGCGAGRDFILRRPFGIHRRFSNKAFEILFQVVGRGTRVLSEVRIHDFVDVIGPLGRPFELPPEGSSALLVAGGLGVAPLVFLAEELAQRKVKFCVLQGSATRKSLLCNMDLKRLARQLFVATDDGSLGHKGFLTDLLGEAIEKSAAKQIFACGPEGMLQATAEAAISQGIGCQLSIERRMACGVGACLSCVCETKEGYKLACKDGPVFRIGELA